LQFIKNRVEIALLLKMNTNRLTYHSGELFRLVNKQGAHMKVLATLAALLFAASVNAAPAATPATTEGTTAPAAEATTAPGTTTADAAAPTMEKKETHGKKVAKGHKAHKKAEGVKHE
jgi:hypothetical protein